MKCDAAKFAGMYETIYKDLYRFALCTLRNPQDAEDAVSEAVIQGYEHIASLRREDAFKSWMFKILSNICKKKQKQNLLLLGNDETQLASVADARTPDQIDLGMDLRQAFGVLTEEEQLIVGLSVFGGYPSKEIADILSLKDGTVRSKRSRALEKMRIVLRPRGASAASAY